MTRSLLPASRRDVSAGAAIAILGISNYVSNRVLPAAAYVPWNVGMAGGLVMLARWAGCTPSELGMDPRSLRTSVRVGAVGAAIVPIGYLALMLTPKGRNVLLDERASELPMTTVASQAVVRIPFGTALSEELVFRGALPALLMSPARPAWLPGLSSSFLFGLWHVLPSRDLLRANEAAGRLAGATTSKRVVGGLVGAAVVAGEVLRSLRERTGHLAAPTIVHFATNVAGLLAARFAGRDR